MTDIIERLATIPKLIFGTATTTTGAIVSTAPDLPLQVASMHPMQIIVWVATVLAGLGTFGLAVVRAVIEIKKARRDMA